VLVPFLEHQPLRLPQLSAPTPELRTGCPEPALPLESRNLLLVDSDEALEVTRFSVRRQSAPTAATT
jgi:hypothetical protein